MLIHISVIGSAHAVDSSELAFRLAAIGAVKQGTQTVLFFIGIVTNR